MIKAGEEWGEPCHAPPDVVMEGDDAALAAAVATHRGALIRFVPDVASDVARAVGLVPGAEPRGWAVPMDALELDDGRLAVNMLILGTAPERATWRTATYRFVVDGREQRGFAIVIATGQFHAGHDLVPRSHPGDQHAELQIYAVPRAERSSLRRRAATGNHLPHPAITQRRITTTTITTATPIPLRIDGSSAGTTRHLAVRLIPNAYRLLL